MQCDRAQEFFSDYLERTLDRPMTVAIESHLAGCANCREEVEVLQNTFLALDSLPEVEPPADGAWQVMMAIRQQRAAQYEAERRKAPTFLEWLRSLNPMGVAMGASLATLVIGGSLLVTGIPHLQLGLGLLPPAVFGKPVVEDGPPSVEVTYGPGNGQSLALEVRVTPTVDLKAGEVRLTGDTLPAAHVAKGDLLRKVPVVFNNVPMPNNAESQVLRVTAQGQGVAPAYDGTIVVPLARRNTEPLTLVLTDQPMIDALRRLAPYLGRPIVVDGVLPSTVTLQAAEMSAPRVLAALAVQSQFTLREDGKVYRLTPTR